jgi:GTP-binding protein
VLEEALSPFPAIPEDLTADVAQTGIKVAVVGRPNVGKSTLVNRILGEERVLVYDAPGTTRDSIFIPFERQNKKYTLIDTAGVRRRRSVDEPVEKFSVVKTLQAISEANVVVFVVDARESLADQDLHLLGFILDSGRALVIAVNKWDGLSEDQRTTMEKALDRRLTFVRFARVHFISALHGSGVGNLFTSINEAYRSATRKLSTPKLTDILERAVESHQPPAVSGRRIKLRYAHAGGSNPPVVVIHGNQTNALPGAYKRYLMNYFRDTLSLKGTPLIIELRSGANPFEGKKNVLTERQVKRRQRLMKHVKKNR